MTVYELSQCDEFNALCLPKPYRKISGAYTGDLLSWVMGKAKTDNIWITVMSNINVVAVASLCDVSCVVLTEGLTLDDDVLATAEQKGVNILSTPLTAFSASVKVADTVS